MLLFLQSAATCCYPWCCGSWAGHWPVWLTGLMMRGETVWSCSTTSWKSSAGTMWWERACWHLPFHWILCGWFKVDSCDLLIWQLRATCGYDLGYNYMIKCGMNIFTVGLWPYLRILCSILLQIAQPTPNHSLYLIQNTQVVLSFSLATLPCQFSYFFPASVS